MKIIENQFKSLSINAHHWKSMKIIENTEKLETIEIIENNRKSVKINENQWKSLKIIE